jgi:RNA polymerase sigma-70 factor (ECF subfamily)
MVVRADGGRSVPVDEEATELFRELYPSLRAFAAVVGSWDVEPDDLVQEALARTLRRHRLTDLDSPAAYLRTAIVNLAASEGRRRAVRRRAWERTASDRSVEQPMPSDLADLELLGPVDRAVVYLVHVEGSSHAEVADLLGITEQASRSRASRAAGALRRHITAEEATP